MRKNKILFLPAGIGLAHVGRSCVLAKELKKRGHAVYFGVGAHSSLVVEEEGFPFEIIPEVSWKDYEERFRRLDINLFTLKRIERFVQSELVLYKKIKPDLIVADVRPTAKISTRIAKIPLVCLANVDATPFYDFTRAAVKLPAQWSRTWPKPVVKFVATDRGTRLLKRLAPLLLKIIILRPLIKGNLVLLRFKQRAITNFYDFLLGDVTLLLDIPQYRPMKDLPEDVHVVGPMFWQGIKGLPPWADKLQKRKITIYVTASGTGDRRILQKIINFLAETPYQVMVTVGNTCKISEINIPAREDFFITNFLPGEWVMQSADLIIFPGGSATAYQALTYGVPQLGIPVNIDQEDSVNQLVRIGTALLLDPFTQLNKQNLLASVKKILHDKEYQKKAMELKRVLSKYDGVKQAADIIEKLDR